MGTMDMRVSAFWTKYLDGLAGRQSVQDAAVTGMLAGDTAGPELPELLLQAAQCLDALRNVTDMRVEQGVDLGAVLLRVILEMQQGPDLVECHVESATVPDELESFDMRLRIGPVVG